MNKSNNINQKKILITAKHSYIGNAFAEWTTDKYDIEFISCRTGEWRELSFSKYDVIFHVAGIAHVDAKANMESMYYKVNRDLTIDLAQKAKSEGVKQFIFMSSAIIFGESSAMNQNVVITKYTSPNPNGFYGNSKLQAEEGIVPMQDDNFNVVIIRPPMIYGEGAKGNFTKLAKLAQITPLFPNIKNQRSMLHIDNLCEFISLIIDNEDYGTFHPQNAEYVNTAEMVKLIAAAHGNKLTLTRVFNPLINLMAKKVNAVNKVFGTFFYEREMSEYKDSYWVRSLEDSIRVTEK